jgi:hypothetical protein
LTLKSDYANTYPPMVPAWLAVTEAIFGLLFSVLEVKLMVDG